MLLAASVIAPAVRPSSVTPPTASWMTPPPVVSNVPPMMSVPFPRLTMLPAPLAAIVLVLVTVVAVMNRVPVPVSSISPSLVRPDNVLMVSPVVPFELIVPPS